MLAVIADKGRYWEPGNGAWCAVCELAFIRGSVQTVRSLQFQVFDYGCCDQIVIQGMPNRLIYF